MEVLETMGWISLIPSALAVILAFATRNTIASLAFACIVGCLLTGGSLFSAESLGAGQGILAFPTLLKTSLGTTSFSWVMLLNLFAAILVAYFRKTGAIQAFSAYVEKKNLGRRGTQLVGWIMGIFVYFSDSFSPLFVGSTMRDLSDREHISREKLAYIADSGAAPVSVLVPITGWAAYLSGLAIGFGCIDDINAATGLFLKAVPLNFYALIAVLFVGLIAAGFVKDFGPMKKAEDRAITTGKVLRDGATPMAGKELTEMEPYQELKPRIFLNFILPVLLIVVFAVTTYIVLGSAKTMEAFLFVIVFMTVSMMIQGIPLKEIMATVQEGIKGGVPAVIILALAYSINALGKTMGTANFIINSTQGLLTPAMLPFLIFVISAFMAFATGSSWGTFAICMPIALPLAFSYTGGEVTVLVAASFAAVAGGGVFGDHCSPLSDTTILASSGAGSDHIDHVKTQLPYALVCAGIASVLYLILGFVSCA